ncbi:FRAS1-related extracellular matrix protein 1b [Acipenser oxyrinchus oxyrinchus]|uniref:FRAS1-related extracellular matrix protein 1b n=1 Tax=Acipenser oxyrinchus oxyrinchus TaxID=40147 RepID=A0AAD8G663_ACIOX|nr:FRAS1-related extracellular matrix protein 1b [Acipenser oxyrinchus oxyrinchus]
MKTAAIATIALLVSASLIDLSLAMADGLVRLNTGVQVGRGQAVYVTNNELQFNIPKEVDSCKVEVVLNEPITQRVGKLGPQVFDCHFLPNEVKYTHNGCPILEEDNVMLKIYRFTESETFVETFLLNVQVKEPEASLIQFGVVHLEVPHFHGVSNPVDGRVVSFNTSPGTICTVRIMSSEMHTPAHGQLVTEDPSKSQKKDATSGSILHKGLRKARQARLPCPSNKACHSGVKEVRFLKANCEDFIHMGLKYQHLSPPSPNVDYIPIRVEIRDEKTRTQLQAENAWIPVKIQGAIQNQQPRGAFMSMFILEVDQFILTPLSTASLDAEDDETPQSRLVFSVTKPPDEGYITHLDDHTKLVSSFSWQDLYEMKIAYQPPNGSHSGRRNFEVEFEAIDGFFLKSPSIMVHFSIRTTETNAPRVSWNMGMDLLEGQSRPITWENFQIVDNDNIHAVYLVTVDGPQHGRLTVRGGKGFMFKVQDIKDGTVRYHHSDSDTTKDYIIFRISDGRHSIRHKFPINILPKDDTPPFLINSVAFELEEGGSVQVQEFMLLASDFDSSDDYILYRLTSPPRAGEIVKKHSPEHSGTPVLSFLQRDLFHGLIYYHHLGGEVFEDSFDFTLSDSHDPPNLSQTHTVVIHISPVKDQLPKEVSDSVRSIVVKETEIAYITKSHLHFRDTESPDTDLMYFVTKPCFSPRSPGVYDAGKLFYTDSMSSMKKDPSVPVLKSFTQHAVNHLKVGYMPPQMDIGPEPLFVQFVFTVTDQQGGELTGLIFNITVNPVDNQKPEIFTNQMKAEEGSGCFITPENLLVRDVDSKEEDLRVQLKRRPQHGDIELQGLAMLEGDFFTLQELQAFKVRYQHDDSETLEDAVVFTATDGFNSADGVLIAQIIPLNDEPPELGAGLKSRLECPEGGQVLITAEYLYATDADSDDAKLTYMLGRTPTHGALRRSGVTVDRFTQLDVIQGLISYVHTGGEIGPSPCSDTVTLIVSDGEAGTVDSCCQDDTIPPVPLHSSLPVYDLNITVLPINNQPPSITVGGMFVVDEGSSTGLLPDSLSASDDDTFPEGLHFLLETPPQYGYLENTLPSPGYEKSNAGLSVVSFSTQHLQNGYIYYVQSQHQGLEPTADHFMVAVSDGVHKSMARPFYVIINPTNDESPLLHLGNLTVMEGGMRELSPSVLNAMDLDTPPDPLSFSLIAPPVHGTVLNEIYGVQRSRYKQMGSEMLRENLPVHRFTLDQLREGMKLVYMHDDTDTLQDSFTIQLTDGKHTVQGTVNIHIVPVNDEKPLLLKNAGLEVDVAENKVISSVLLEAEDKDTPRERLLYIINTSPAFGQLHLKMPSGWVPLHPGMNFTQEEVDMNRLWYLHTTILGSKGHDSFCFYLTDLENQSPLQSFYISLRNTHKGDIVLLTRSVTLTEGDRVTLTTDVLLATDGTGKAEELLYAISVPPAHGHIEYINYPGVPIAGFSQLDVAAQKVCYVHDNSHEALADSFSFVVSNGLTTRNGSLKFVIEHMDRVPPTLLSNKGLQLLEGAMVTITSEVLELTDPDTVVGNLTYSITQQPRHGRLFLKGKALPMGRFTQTDVNDLDLTYQHNGGQAEIDQFTFAASDGTNEGFLLYGQLRKEPVVFTIQVDHIDKSSPRIVTKGRPSTVEGLKDGRFVIYITARSLKAMDQDSKDEELDFTILRPPHSGYLENAITGEYVKGRFTQRDLNLRSIRYVINPSIEVTGDSFEFRVSDPAGNAMLPEVMELTWSRIELAAQCFRVCENVGTLSIQVVRSGNSEDPSYIGIQVQEDSAKVGRDFTHSSASLIQFDPGVSTKTWNIFLKDDGLEENNEKFKIQLRVPKNAILGQKDKASVEIIDPRGGSCDPEELRPDGNVEMSFIPAVDRPSKGRSSVSHPEKGSSSKREEPWERYASPPRGDVPQTDHYLDYSGGVVQEEVSRPQMRKHLQVVGSSRRVRPSGVERKNEETVWTFHGIIPLRVEEKSVAVPVQPSSFQTDLHVPHSWSWQPSSLHLNRGGEIPQGDSPPVYISAPAILSTSVDNSSCPPGWTLHGKYCYSLSPSYLATWERAEKDCRLMFQSHLVSVHSEKEIKWLWKFAGKLPFWIGLTDQGEPGRWVWTNGRPVSFTKLKQGAKSSEGGAVSRCVLMQDKKRWILRSCNMRKERFVCSLPALRH